MKYILRIIGVLGVLIFGAAFFFTFGVPGLVEGKAQEFIKQKIESETNEKIDSLSVVASESGLGKLASKLLKGQEAEVASLRSKLKEKTYEKTAAVIAEMSDLSCECRDTYAQRLKGNIELRISSLASANAKIVDFMKSKYMDVSKNLTQDLRIFTGSNLLMFVLLLVASLMKPKAVIQLFVPGLLLASSTLVCSYLYLFEQNWFFTIVYNDFLGFWYLAYVVALFLWLCDVVFNRARVTTRLVNYALQFIGSALQALPC